MIPADIRQQLFTLWLDAAQHSLGTNQTTFAIVPLRKLLGVDGYLAALRENGYTIDPPR